jgi:hypothetical protein
MRRYYFSMRYDGVDCDEEDGEVFPSMVAAIQHAAIVAAELSRNNPKQVSVFVSAADGADLGRSDGLPCSDHDRVRNPSTAPN